MKTTILLLGLMIGGGMYVFAQQGVAPKNVNASLSPQNQSSQGNTVNNLPANNNLPTNTSSLAPADPNAVPELPSGNLPDNRASLNPNLDSQPKKD